jgi:hypothetical protein
MTNKTEIKLPPPFKKAVYATSANTKSVRDGVEMGGYEKEPPLFDDAQMHEYARAAVEADRRARMHDKPSCVSDSAGSDRQADRKRRGEPVYLLAETDGMWSETNEATFLWWRANSPRAARVLYTTPQPAEPDEWKLAVDHELTNIHSTADSFPSAKEAVKALVDWHVAVATDPVFQQPAEPVKVLSKDEIRAIMLKHGYTVKPGHDDLKPYVYAAAQELIETYAERIAELVPADPVKVPSDEELPGMWESADLSGGATDCQPAQPAASAIPVPTTKEEYIALLDMAIELGKKLNIAWEDAFRATKGQPAASAEPSGYAYRYPDGIRFNDGSEVNGCKPTETLPYWFGAAPVAQEPVAYIVRGEMQRDQYRASRAQAEACERLRYANFDGEDQTVIIPLYAAPVAAQAQPQQSENPEALADTQRAIIEAAERRGYARAEAENVGYRTDAGRYRFIRLLTGDLLDAAIDAARAAARARPVVNQQLTTDQDREDGK